jgi:hypothetical protein
MDYQAARGISASEWCIGDGGSRDPDRTAVKPPVVNPVNDGLIRPAQRRSHQRPMAQKLVHHIKQGKYAQR